MEKLSKGLEWCFQHFPDIKNIMRAMGDGNDINDDDDDDEKNFDFAEQCKKKNTTSRCRDHSETSKKIFSIIERIIMWENSLNSIAVVVVFNLLFWGIVVLEIRGFAAASSAALVAILSYSILEAQIEKEEQQHLNKSLSSLDSKIKSGFDNLILLRKNQPGVFCCTVCTASILLWLIGGAINGIFTTYTICMSILLGPALIVRIPRKIFISKEWENIDEYLPIVTEDNLQLLNRVGDTGDQCPPEEARNLTLNHLSPDDPFNDDELVGLKMPSHEDPGCGGGEGSTDGLELSELELSGGDGDNETDIDGIKIKSRHFKRVRGSSSSSSSSLSEDEQHLELDSKDLSSGSDDDDDGSEFEVIDSNEINRSSNNS